LRKSGYSSQYGAEIKTGFFWAIAKDMDASLYLDWLGKRGFKEGLEYRYNLAKETVGRANFYFIDDQVLNKNRYAFFVQHQQKLPDDFYLKGFINHVSDHQYLRDFYEDLPVGSRIDSRSSSLLRSYLFGGKDWDKFSLLAQAAVYDDLTQTSNDETVQKLPQVSFYAHPQSLFNMPLFFDLTSSYTNFYREKGVEAQRGDLFPSVSYPVRLFNVLKLTSNIGPRETFYQSSNDPTHTIQGWRSRETFEAGTALSTEFYRVYDGASLSTISSLYKVAKWMHTIEPTVGYSYIPRVNQSRLPSFDDVDQIPYTNQITYGITQRLLGKPEKEGINSGPKEYGKLTIFQNYSLGDPFTTDENGKAHSFSNIQAELWWNFGPYVSSRWSTEFDPYQMNFSVLNGLVQVKDRRNDAIQVQYRYTKDNNKQFNLDARVKALPSLYLFGSLRYDLLNHWRVESIYGAEYQSQCWNLGFALEDWGQSPDGNQKKELKYEIYFTLLNMGAVGLRPYQMGL
jgi:LPS-assembly protein